MPKVSIILAVYNVEKYLKQCLDSLINQTLQDIEIICTDDGSTDSSLNILKEYQTKDGRIKIIEQKNQGPGVARNNAIDAATGKYIMIVDPDDWLELNGCELAYNQIENNQNDFVIFDYKRYIENTGKYETDEYVFLPYKDVIDNPHIDVHKLETNFFQNGFTWGKIYSKKFLQDNSIKYAPLYLCEDIPFMLMALITSHSISVLNERLYVYRIRETSACSNVKRWKDLLDTREYVADYLLKNKFNHNILVNYTEYIYNSLLYWYNKFSLADKSVKKPFKKEMFKLFDRMYDYTNNKCKFRYFIYKYNLEDIYYKLIRPIGKYCIVLPYRRIKKFLKVHK